MSGHGAESNFPVEFGYKIHWLAISGVDSSLVAEALDLQRIRPCSWKEGIERSYLAADGQWQDVYISPSMKDWTLAVGGTSGIPQAGNPAWTVFLREISKKLGVVQYFGSHRVVGYVAWAKANSGRLIRAYGYSDGETLVDYGDLTPEERSIGLDLLNTQTATGEEMEAHEWRTEQTQNEIFRFQAEHPDGPRTVDECQILDSLLMRASCQLPDEDTILWVADRWSINPLTLNEWPDPTPLGLMRSLRVGRWL